MMNEKNEKTVNEKCLFLNRVCEGKEFCDICPVYYDWAVYEIYKKECITKVPDHKHKD